MLSSWVSTLACTQRNSACTTSWGYDSQNVDTNDVGNVLRATIAKQLAWMLRGDRSDELNKQQPKIEEGISSSSSSGDDPLGVC